MSKININKVKENLLEMERQKSKKNKRSYNKAKRDFDNIVNMIIRDYNPNKIYSWGSILNSENFREYSDIDIGICGVTKPELFFELVGKAMRMTDFTLDIVQMEKITPEFADTIRMKGKVIYEKKE